MSISKLLPFFAAMSLLLISHVSAANTQSENKATIQSTSFTINSKDSSGKPFNLEKFRGKTILVSFYSAGCTICARDLKLMRDFYRDNIHKDFVIVAVNLETTKKDFDQYLHLINLIVPKNQQFPIIWRNQDQHKDSFGEIKKDPTHFLISNTGKLILKREGTFLADDWNNLWELLEP
jgi:peroxiredoxin